MEYKMLTERRSEEAKRVRRQMMKQGKDWSPRRGKILVPRTDGLVQALQTGLTKDHYVLAIPKSTNTHHQSMKGNFQELKIMGTSPKSTQKNFQISTVSSAVFLAKHFLSQGSVQDLKIQEGHSSLTLREYCEQNNLDYSSLKTLKDFSVTTVDELLKPSSKRLTNWGTTANGKCLTARISASPKTESGSTLSDILEERPDPKYFLSPEQTEKILKSWGQSPNQSGQDDMSKSEESTLQTA